jgi:3-oxoacyl-[acyl-carrier-protein] synthase II
VSGGGDPLAILSGTSGAEPALSEEREALERLAASGRQVAARAYGSILGHMLEPHFPAGIALAALAISQGHFYPPFDGSGAEAVWDGAPENIVVSSVGHWRGEAAALISGAGRS